MWELPTDSSADDGAAYCRAAVHAQLLGNSQWQAAISDEAPHPCTIAFSIMQWMPLEPLTVCVTRKSAARLQSV
jgi:hypothetical protein